MCNLKIEEWLKCFRVQFDFQANICSIRLRCLRFLGFKRKRLTEVPFPKAYF